MEIHSMVLLAGAVGAGSGYLVSRGTDALSAKVAGLFDKSAHNKAEVLAKRFIYSFLAADAAWECMLASKVASILLKKNLMTALFFKPLLEQLLIHSCLAAFSLAILIRGLVVEAKKASPQRGWQNSLAGIWLALHFSAFLGPLGLGSLGYLAGITLFSKGWDFLKKESPDKSFPDGSIPEI